MIKKQLSTNLGRQQSPTIKDQLMQPPTICKEIPQLPTSWQLCRQRLLALQ